MWCVYVLILFYSINIVCGMNLVCGGLWNYQLDKHSCQNQLTNEGMCALYQQSITLCFRRKSMRQSVSEITSYILLIQGFHRSISYIPEEVAHDH